MVKLGIDPGCTRGNKGYMFNLYCCPDYNVIYLDIKPQDFKCNRDAHNFPTKNDSIDEIVSLTQ